MSNILQKANEVDCFLADSETLDFSDLLDKQFMVAVSTGKRRSTDFLPSTIRGPFLFTEMVNYVGAHWHENMVHSKVFITSKELETENVFLDENTTDNIECKYEDIIINVDFEIEQAYTAKASTFTKSDLINELEEKDEV